MTSYNRGDAHAQGAAILASSSPQLKVLPGHFEVRIGFRLMNSARDVTGQVITHLTCTRSREVVSAMKSARSVLLLKVGAVCVETYRQEAPTSNYAGQPLAATSLDDLPMEQLK